MHRVLNIYLANSVSTDKRRVARRRRALEPAPAVTRRRRAG
jgi:hypothetical protein